MLPQRLNQQQRLAPSQFPPVEDFNYLFSNLKTHCMGHANNVHQYPTKDEKLYTTQQAADILQVSVRTVFNHRNMGLLDFIQACEKSPVYFTEAQLSAYRQRIYKSGNTDNG